MEQLGQFMIVYSFYQYIKIRNNDQIPFSRKPDSFEHNERDDCPEINYEMIRGRSALSFSIVWFIN